MSAPRLHVVGVDPHGRFDVVRQTVAVPLSVAPFKPGCTFCGRLRTRSGVELPTLFEYGTWPDGGWPTWARGAFCSLSCFRMQNRIPPHQHATPAA